MIHIADPLGAPAVLMLKDGTFLKGLAVGHRGTTSGELCFNTGMMGYEEMYTDPSYYGQIIIDTQSHVGNYGVRERQEEAESDKPKIRGCVLMGCSSFFSREKASAGLSDYLKKHKIPAIEGIDTRALVRHLRHEGSMNAVLSSLTTDREALKAALHALPNMHGLELASRVSTKKTYNLPQRTDKKRKRVAVLDLGVKNSILRHLARRGIACSVYPWDTSFEAMEATKPDGYLLSNGPGDPASMPKVVEQVKKMITQNKALFGICLGHQLLALACGISTYKLSYGHRGVNHPIKKFGDRSMRGSFSEPRLCGEQRGSSAIRQSAVNPSAP